MKRICCLVLLLVIFATPVVADKRWQEQYGNTSLLVEQVADGLGIPWGLAFLNEMELLITERSGQLKQLSLETGQIQAISGLPAISVKGQGGLLDIAVADGAADSSWIYFTYSKEHQGKDVTTLARAKLNGNQLIEWQELLVTQSASDTGRHFGSRIAFDGEGHLFFTVGDRGDRPNGQDLTTHAGSVLRLHLDGTVPADNPFVKQDGALPEIWSYGHRNPQGIFFDRDTQRLWIIEHGPRGGDEINLVKPGLNYGWPVVSHGKEYWGPLAVGEAKQKEGMEDPLKVYIPSIAPSSLLIYSGKLFPEWQGNFFSGALAMTHLNRLVVDKALSPKEEQRLFENKNERIRDVIEHPDGSIFFSTDSGKIFRLSAKPEGR